jgi:hypothetical protein
LKKRLVKYVREAGPELGLHEAKSSEVKSRQREMKKQDRPAGEVEVMR